MKPFDLEAAKAGAPVITRDGRDARIVSFDRGHKTYKLIGLVAVDDTEENICSFTLDGKYIANDNHKLDLFMKPVKKTYWVNIYKYAIGRGLYAGAFMELEEDAKRNAAKDKFFVKTISFEVEE